MQAIIVGAEGKMGKAIKNFSGENDFFVAAEVDKDAHCFSSPYEYTGEADVIIEFALPEATSTTLAFAQSRGIPAVIGTTGHSDEQKEAIRKYGAYIPVFIADNFSVGIAAVAHVLKSLRNMLSDWQVEIIETHHTTKKDSPGGTAKILASVAGGAGIHSLRMGDTVGTHEIVIGKGFETVYLKHEALSRNVFAKGAIEAARFIVNQSNGIYGMEDLLSGEKL